MMNSTHFATSHASMILPPVSTLLHESNSDSGREAAMLKKAGKPRKDVTKEQIIELMHLEQQQAAKILDVSVSTLKRRFQEYFNTKSRWPAPSQRSKIIKQRRHAFRNKVSIPMLLRDEPVQEKYIDPSTHLALLRAFK